MFLPLCYEVTFVKGVWKKSRNLTGQVSSISTALGKSSDLTVSGIGHSVIRGLVTNRLMVRRELCDLKAWIMVAHANIEWTQIARTLQ